MVAYESVATPIRVADAEMSKDSPRTGSDRRALPALLPARDARVWARLVRVLFRAPGFLAIRPLTTDEPAGFALAVELPMRSTSGDHGTP